MKPYFEEDGIVIYHGDCREILPPLPPADLVLTDPPYGQKRSGGTGEYGKRRLAGITDPRWDDNALSSSDIDLIIPSGKFCIIWGGNYFQLPPSRMFFIWDKGAGFRGRDFAECEYAWCSWDGNAKVLTRDPLACRDYIGKQHPTEKPLVLMTWCILQCPSLPETIIDPFCGSGSSLVSAKLAGAKAIGIEINERYCEIAAKRLSQGVLPLEAV